MREPEAWTTKGPGRDYVRLSSEDWGRAAIASGVDRDEALAAVGRTTAFYTGTPDPGRDGAQGESQ